MKGSVKKEEQDTMPSAAEGSGGKSQSRIQSRDLIRDDGMTRLWRLVPAPGTGASPMLCKEVSGAPDQAKTISLHNDYQIVAGNELSCTLKLLRQGSREQELRLFFRDPGGVLLDSFDGSDLLDVLTVAHAMAVALGDVHEAGLLHRDLRPDSFLWTGEKLFIVDFSRTVKIRREYRDIHNPGTGTEQLAYHSPELTGRLNRPVDYRSDYYSLGIVLYRILTGRLPFYSDDPLELIFQHLSARPPHPNENGAKLPETLVAVLFRLLEKDPEQRYQNATALCEDLMMVRGVLRGTQSDDPSLLSRQMGGRLLDVPHRLYGREEERQRLLQSLERAFERQPQLLLVTGPSGIGKSTLIRETYLPVTRQRAFFVSGKFDQVSQGKPYSAWTMALQDIVAYILAEPSDSLEWWRSHLATVLGHQAAILASIIPTLDTLMGDLPEPEALPPAEAREQLREAFIRFFRVFARAERPVVVFLDDLQWIDNGSLDLLSGLVSTLDRLPMLLIGAYRNNEVGPGHPLQIYLRNLADTGCFSIRTITLEALRSEDIANLVASSTTRPTGQVNEFCAELERRTGGNPFFLWQLLRTLHEDGSLYVDENGYWDWSIAAIRRSPFSDEVADLMAHRFGNLPARCRELLSWAACLGMNFDIRYLAWLAECRMSTLLEALQVALDEEFILPVGEQVLEDEKVMHRHLRFLHDRMQEVAYAALPDEDRSGLHLRIAGMLRHHLTRDDLEERITEIAGHLNSAQPLLTTDEQGLDLARVNLAAARQAKATAAFVSALGFIRHAMMKLPDDLWETEPQLAYSLYRERGELEYLNSEFDSARRFVNEAIRHERDSFNRADLYHMLIIQSTLRARYSEAVAVGREGLAQLGVQLPATELGKELESELGVVLKLLEKSSLDRLGNLPPMEKSDNRAVMKLLIALGPPCYRAHPDLWSVVVAKQARLCLEYGTVAEASYTYPALGGLMMHTRLGDGSDCSALYRATMTLMSQFSNPSGRSMGHLMMGSSLSHWFKPMAEASQDYMEAYRIGQASGNLQYAVYGFGHDTYCRFLRGEPLDELIPVVLDYLGYAHQRGNLWGIDLMTGALRIMQLLHGEWLEDDWPGKNESEQEYLNRCHDNENVQVLCLYHMMRVVAMLLRDRPEDAEHSLLEASKRLDSIAVQGLLPSSWFPGLKVMVLLERSSSRTAIDTAISEALQHYEHWRYYMPDNFNYWYYWLLAEQGGLRQNVELALDNFELAHQEARRQGHWQIMALVAERAKSYWRNRGRESFAGVYERYSSLALELGGAHKVMRADNSGTSGSLEMNTIIQMSQMLSRHMELPELVPEIIRTVAFQTGAKRVVLSLARTDDLRVVMDRDGSDEQYYDEPLLLDACDSVPQAVIRYVARAQKMLHFSAGDIESTLLLRNDPYLCLPDGCTGLFTGEGWCVPLSYLGELVGALYMESGETPGGFDEQQKPLVEFLASQAAISLRNIDLIKRLAEEARARQEAELRIRTADAELESRRLMEEKLKKLSNTDALTGLANRRMFFSVLKDCFEQFQENQGMKLSLLMLDIDHFKSINDHYGHATGDEVLVHLAEQFHRTLRPLDLPARIGGEEFTIILREGDHEQAMGIANRLRKNVESSTVTLAGQDVHYTVSIGVAHFEAEDANHNVILERADRALYRAKASGRNAVSD